MNVIINIFMCFLAMGIIFGTIVGVATLCFVFSVWSFDGIVWKLVRLAWSLPTALFGISFAISRSDELNLPVKEFMK